MAVTLTPKERLSYRIIKLVSTDASANIDLTGGAVTVYGMLIINSASQVNHICFLDGSMTSADAVGTKDPTLIIPMVNATTKTMIIPDGLTFSSGINVWTKQEAGTAGTTAPSGGSITIYLTTGV